MTEHIRWTKGGAARLVSMTADAIVLRSTVPSPPGSRLEGSLEGRSTSVRSVVRVKVHSSKRQPDGAFLLEGRLLDVTREVRSEIAALLAGAVGSTPEARGSEHAESKDRS